MRIISSIPLIFCSFCFLYGSPHFDESLQSDFLYREKLRVGYIGSENIKIVPEIARSGINLVAVKFQHLRVPIQRKQLKRLEEWASICKRYGIKFMPVINLWHYEKYWIRPKHHYYYESTEFVDIPCPLEEDVYKLTVHQRVLELGKLSRFLPIDGVIIDLEMYQNSLWSYPDYCLCDYCFERFLAGRRVEKPIFKPLRQEYLNQSNQINAYRDFTQNYISRLAHNTKIQTEDISPGFMIGAFHLDLDKPYYKGALEGFSAGEKPVLVFTEKTFKTGHSPYIHKIQKRFHDLGINAKLVVGIWQDKIPPENLAEQYYYCAKDSAGYWVYTMGSLFPSAATTMPYSKEKYWRAIFHANNELDKVNLDPTYKSKLKIRSFHIPPAAIDNTNVNLSKLQYIKPLSKFTTKTEDSNLRFRGKIKLIFIAQKGEEIKFQMSLKKLGKSSQEFANVVITNSTGRILTESLLDVKKVVNLKISAPYTGAYALICDAGENSMKAISWSHLFSIAAARKINLFKPKQTLYFWKPDNCLSAQVSFEADGVGESFTATFRNQSGIVLAKYDILAKKTVHIPFGQKALGEVISLSVTPRTNSNLEDVVIEIKSGFDKYFSPFANGLIRTKREL